MRSDPITLDKTEHAIQLFFILDLLKHYFVFVSRIEKLVIKLFGLRFQLFVPKHQIDPILYIFSHISTFQSFPLLENEMFTVHCPWRKNHIINLVLFLGLPEIQFTNIP